MCRLETCAYGLALREPYSSAHNGSVSVHLVFFLDFPSAHL